MALKSSKNGKAAFGGTDIPHARGWTLNLTDDVQPFNTSATAGVRGRVSGVRDSTGTITFYQDTADDIEAVLREGDTGDITLYEDGSRLWTVPAIIISIDMNVNIETGEIESGTITFGQTGAVTAPT